MERELGRDVVYELYLKVNLPIHCILMIINVPLESIAAYFADLHRFFNIVGHCTVKLVKVKSDRMLEIGERNPAMALGLLSLAINGL